MRFLLALAILFLPVTVSATPRCILDTTNPAITHSVIPLHDFIQGITQYNDPSEWAYSSGQIQWATTINPILGHDHTEVCHPYRGEISGPLTIPFRVRGFKVDGVIYSAWGNLVRDVVFDDGISVLPGDPNGETFKTGHLTLDPLMPGDGGPNIHSAAKNGWTNFRITTAAVLPNGDTFQSTVMIDLFTKLDPSAPEDSFFTRFGTKTNALFKADPQLNAWGDGYIDIAGWPLPLLQPINEVWSIPSMLGYSYGAAASLQNGVMEMRKDVDLHHGIIGTHLNTFGVFDPVEIGPGKHNISMSWTVNSGSDGIPGIAAPNETVISILVVSVEVGSTTTETCQDPIANNFGGPLPCTYPVIDWHTITGILQRLNDTIRICDPIDSKCTDPLVIH